MPKQGDLSLLNDPVAKELLQSTRLARFAYIWTDGTPRVVPVWFHWDGKDLVMAGPPDAPKMKSLPKNSKVAVTIDSETWPYHALMVRGAAACTVVDGLPPEYVAAAHRYMGDEAGDAWVANVNQMSPKSARIAIRPAPRSMEDLRQELPRALVGRVLEDLLR